MRPTTLALLRLLRKASRSGVLVVSGKLAADNFGDVIGLGADLCLAKPVTFDQKLLGIEAVYRRSGPSAEAPAAWRLDETQCLLLAPDGARISLSESDLQVLACLRDAAGEVVEPEQALRLPSAVDHDGRRHALPADGADGVGHAVAPPPAPASPAVVIGLAGRRAGLAADPAPPNPARLGDLPGRGLHAGVVVAAAGGRAAPGPWLAALPRAAAGRRPGTHVQHPSAGGWHAGGGLVCTRRGDRHAVAQRPGAGLGRSGGRRRLVGPPGHGPAQRHPGSGAVPGLAVRAAPCKRCANCCCGRRWP